jgi:hypothetical protein
MEQFEDIMDYYFRKDPVEEANDAVNKMVKDYNQLIKEGQKNIEDKKIKLDERIVIIRKIETQISDLDKKLKKINADVKNKKSIDEHNTLVKKRNGLVEKHKSHSGLYKEYETDVNTLVKHFNEKSEIRRKKIEKAKKAADDIVTQYHNWINDDGDLVFFNELNRNYALLHAEKRNSGKNFEKMSEIQKIQSIRKELGEYARKKHEAHENGLIVVKAILCGTEKAFFIVDTGASMVTVPLEIVEVLGLTDKLGEEVNLTLAGGIRTKGRKLIIPEISVFGKTARSVEAVALAPSEAGIDGLLGHTFLNCFNYRIDKTHDPKLILKNKDSSKR